MASAYLLTLGYGLGVIGSLWDWRQHLAGQALQAPHLMIDAGGLLAIGVLAFADRRGLRWGAFVAAYLLVPAVAVLILGPFGLMMLAPHSRFTRAFMAWGMTTGGLIGLLPLLLLAMFASWGWLRATSPEPWRLAAAGAMVVVALGTAIDLQWHQTHPMASDMSMNMLLLPGHQVILAGFVVGLVGALVGTTGKAGGS